MKVTIEKLQLHRDERGAVFEPLDAASIAGHRNVHVVISHPGVARANHHHHRGTETMIIYGPALVRYRDEGAVRESDVAADDVVRFTFPPGVTHAVQNTGSQPNVIVCFNTEEHDPERPDVSRDVLI